MYTYKTGLSTSEHDRFVIDSPQTNLLQSSSWAKIKDSWGNDRLGFYQDGNLVAVASVLIQPLPLGFSMIYIPRGPIMDYQDKELLAFVMASLKKYAKTKRALFAIPKTIAKAITTGKTIAFNLLLYIYYFLRFPIKSIIS